MESPTQAPRPAATPDRPTIVASEHIVRNVESVAALHARADEGLDHHQRRIEWITSLIGRPGTLYLICILVVVWAAINEELVHMGKPAIDPPPFFWLQGLVALLALMVTTMVLTTQSRIAKVVEKRAHLELQVNLLAEQKIAKLIALVEELRRDLPNVPNRVDTVAESMARAVNPEHVLGAIEEKLEEQLIDEAAAARGE